MKNPLIANLLEGKELKFSSLYKGVAGFGGVSTANGIEYSIYAQVGSMTYEAAYNLEISNSMVITPKTIKELTGLVIKEKHSEKTVFQWYQLNDETVEI